ncbi:MAG: hypothetical protein KDB68_06790 [Planctomycetes bacterium]|nr:hypothetical protein [Planctomycetota bacterium]
MGYPLQYTQPSIGIGQDGSQQLPEQYRAGNTPKKSNSSKVIGFGIAAVVVAVIVGAAIWGATGGGIDANGVWHHHIARAGEYEADFPEQPEPSVVSIFTPLGAKDLKSVRCIVSGVSFEVAYFDIGGDQSSVDYDYDVAADAMAQEVGAVLKPGIRTHTLDDYEGRIYSMTSQAGRESMFLLLRRRGRIYLVLCEEFTDGQRDAAERFIESFRLIGQAEKESFRKFYTTVGNGWVIRESVSRGGSLVLKQETQFEVVGATASEVEVRTTTTERGASKVQGRPFRILLELLRQELPPRREPIETMTTAAGVFECARKSVGDQSSGTTTWTDLTTGLVVREETLAEGKIKAVSELVALTRK